MMNKQEITNENKKIHYKYLIEAFENMKKHTKITLLVNNYSGKWSLVKCRYMGEIKQYGYISNIGSWGLYNTGKFKEKKCYSILVKIKHKRFLSWLDIELTVLDCFDGWEGHCENKKDVIENLNIGGIR